MLSSLTFHVWRCCCCCWVGVTNSTEETDGDAGAAAAVAIESGVQVPSKDFDRLTADYTKVRNRWHLVSVCLSCCRNSRRCMVDVHRLPRTCVAWLIYCHAKAQTRKRLSKWYVTPSLLCGPCTFFICRCCSPLRVPLLLSSHCGQLCRHPFAFHVALSPFTCSSLFHHSSPLTLDLSPFTSHSVSLSLSRPSDAMTNRHQSSGLRSIDLFGLNVPFKNT